MTTYSAPLRDFRFVLNDLLAIENHRNLPGFEDASTDVVGRHPRRGRAKVCEDVISPAQRNWAMPRAAASKTAR